jgi:hypothetical protein
MLLEAGCRYPMPAVDLECGLDGCFSVQLPLPVLPRSSDKQHRFKDCDRQFYSNMARLCYYNEPELYDVDGSTAEAQLHSNLRENWRNFAVKSWLITLCAVETPVVASSGASAGDECLYDGGSVLLRQLLSLWAYDMRLGDAAAGRLAAQSVRNVLNDTRAQALLTVSRCRSLLWSLDHVRRSGAGAAAIVDVVRDLLVLSPPLAATLNNEPGGSCAPLTVLDIPVPNGSGLSGGSTSGVDRGAMLAVLESPWWAAALEQQVWIPHHDSMAADSVLSGPRATALFAFAADLQSEHARAKEFVEHDEKSIKVITEVIQGVSVLLADEDARAKRETALRTAVMHLWLTKWAALESRLITVGVVNQGRAMPDVHWKLDYTETFSRMRPRLAVLQNFNPHLEAIRGGVPGAAKPEQRLIGSAWRVFLFYFCFLVSN